MQTLGLVADGAFETVLFYSSFPVSAISNSFTERDQLFESYLLQGRVHQNLAGNVTDARSRIWRTSWRNPHSTMPWHWRVVLIAGSTVSALRALRLPNFRITPALGGT
jgi:hypothetical protein